MSIDFKKETKNNTKDSFLCRWVTFVLLLSKAAYSCTLCAMNFVTSLAAARCFRGVRQQITRATEIIVFVGSWLYSVVISGISLFDDGLSALSASKLTCQLNWSSQEKLHVVYNAFVVTTTVLLPMLICFAVQCHLARSVQGLYSQGRVLEVHLTGGGGGGGSTELHIANPKKYTSQKF